MGSTILLQAVLTPLVGVFFLLVAKNALGRRAGWVAVASLLYSTVVLLGVGVRVWQGEVLRESYMLIAPGMRLGLLADGLSLPTVFVIAVLCTALAFFSIPYMEHRIEILYSDASDPVRWQHYRRFFCLYLLFPVGFLGVGLSTNLLFVYFFQELLTLTLYFLMAYFGYLERVRVAFICLVWGVVGMLFVLAASALVYHQTGSFEIASIPTLAGTAAAKWVIGLTLLGLLTKLAVVPFHVWMPWVHAEHPTCIAGLLAVYANLALYLVIRVLVISLGSDFVTFGPPLMVMALVTMVYGSLLAMAQTDIKRLAACSTVSQIAYSVLGVAALCTLSIEGGMFFFLSHVMGKTIFFSTAGIVVYATGVRDMGEMGGLARKMPATAILWVIGAMMLSGFPPFAGFTAEWIMFAGVFRSGLAGSPFGLVIAVLAVAAILLTVAYTFASARRIFFGPLNPAVDSSSARDPGWIMSAPLFVVAGMSALLGLYPRLLMDLLHRVLG